MPGKESKADEKQKQVGDEHSFMGKMREQAGEACPFDEAGAQKLLDDDDAQAGQSGLERMPMKNCDAGKRGGEQQKIDQHRTS
jgi:hypothetical protein